MIGRSFTRDQLRQIAASAARMWSIYSGGWAVGEIVAEDRDMTLVVCRAASPEPVDYPSLVDASLVWLLLGSYAPGAEVHVLEWDAKGHYGVRGERGGGRWPRYYADRIAADATRPSVPQVLHVEPGRSAWEQAGFLAAKADPCRACPFREGSNLDCPVCREVVLRRKASARWQPRQIAAGLSILEFDGDLAQEAVQATERALRQVREPFLSRSFFSAWARRFAQASAEIFANDDDRDIARDMIEGQMVQPWFDRPPVDAAPEPLVDPIPTEAEISTQARRLLRTLTLRGLPRAQAERRVRAVVLLRRLLATEGAAIERELEGVTVEIAGDLERPVQLLRTGGRPLGRVSMSLTGRSIELADDLDAGRRGRITAALDRIHARVAAEVAAKLRPAPPGADDEAPR